MCQGLSEDTKEKVREGLESNRINASTIKDTKKWLEGLIDAKDPSLSQDEVAEVFS
jgi:hypothetical protein